MVAIFRVCSFEMRLGVGVWFGIINAFVHTIMYYYYYLQLAAEKGKGPTWGHHITKVQMTQMVLGTLHASAFVFPGLFSCVLVFL